MAFFRHISHDDAARGLVVIAKHLDAALQIVGGLLLLGLLFEVQAHEAGEVVVQVAEVGLHDDVLATHGTLALAVALHLDDAADAKDVAAGQAHGQPGDAHTDRTRVVLDARDRRHDVVRHLGAKFLGYALGQEPLRMHRAGEGLRGAEAGLLVEFWKCDGSYELVLNFFFRSDSRLSMGGGARGWQKRTLQDLGHGSSVNLLELEILQELGV